MTEPRGSWVAIPTPFQEDGAINFDMFERIIAFQAENGSRALLVMGSCGEATLLDGEERRRIVDRVTAFARGKIPVYFGTTCPSTRDTIALTRYAEEAGADGAVLVVPPYVTPPQDAIFEHFAMVASSVKFPLALYNNPTRVHVNIDPDTIARLHREAPHLSMDKEAMADASQITEVLALTNRRVHVYCCDYPKYGLIAPTLGLGGSGVAGVTANAAPAEMAGISEPWGNGTDLDAWRHNYFRMLPLMKAMYWFTNPVVIKASLNLLGFRVGSVRRPLTDLKGVWVQKLDGILTELGLKERYARWTTRSQFPSPG